jgi:hypothetical protein
MAVMTGNARSLKLGLVFGVAVVFAGQALAADVYKGTAKFTAADGKRTSVPVTISIDEPTPEAERKAIGDKARNDMAGAKSLLAAQKEIGYIEAVDHRVPIRYAVVSPGDYGSIITVISNEPLGFIGGNKASAKPKEGFDLTYAMISVDASGAGRGEMSPAAKVKFMESGAPAVEDYGKQVVWLDDVAKVK